MAKSAVMDLRSISIRGILIVKFLRITNKFREIVLCFLKVEFQLKVDNLDSQVLD